MPRTGMVYTNNKGPKRIQESWGDTRQYLGDRREEVKMYQITQGPESW